LIKEEINIEERYTPLSSHFFAVIDFSTGAMLMILREVFCGSNEISYICSSRMRGPESPLLLSNGCERRHKRISSDVLTGVGLFLGGCEIVYE
jgi:hypothetical protein